MSDAATVSPAANYQYFVNNTWRAPKSGAMFNDYEPYSGNVFAEVPACGTSRNSTSMAINNPMARM